MKKESDLKVLLDEGKISQKDYAFLKQGRKENRKIKKMKGLLFVILILSSVFANGQKIRHNQLKAVEAGTSDSVMFYSPAGLYTFGLLDTTAIVSANWETYIEGKAGASIVDGNTIGQILFWNSTQWDTIPYSDFYYNPTIPFLKINTQIDGETSSTGYLINLENTRTSGKGILLAAGDAEDEILSLWNYDYANQVLELLGSGSLQLPQYGSGTFTGTATKWLAVTSTGLIIEEEEPTSSLTLPASSTDNAIATWDGTGGDALQSTDVKILSGGKIDMANGAAGQIIFPDIDPATYVSSPVSSAEGVVFMDQSDDKLYFRNSVGTYDLTASGSSLWTEDTNGITYSSGNVGIGGASVSTHELKVTGNAAITGDLTVSFDIIADYVAQNTSLYYDVPDPSHTGGGGVVYSDEDDDLLYYKNSSDTYNLTETGWTISDNSVNNGGNVTTQLGTLSSSNPSIISTVLINITDTSDGYYGHAQMIVSGSYNGGTYECNYTLVVDESGANVTVSALMNGAAPSARVANATGSTLEVRIVRGP